MNALHNAQCLADLERFADRRAQLVASLDYEGMALSERVQVVADDERIAEHLAWGYLYVEHLADMNALGYSLAGVSPLMA